MDFLFSTQSAQQIMVFVVCNPMCTYLKFYFSFVDLFNSSFVKGDTIINIVSTEPLIISAAKSEGISNLSNF